MDSKLLLTLEFSFWAPLSNTLPSFSPSTGKGLQLVIQDFHKLVLPCLVNLSPTTIDVSLLCETSSIFLPSLCNAISLAWNILPLPFHVSNLTHPPGPSSCSLTPPPLSFTLNFISWNATRFLFWMILSQVDSHHPFEKRPCFIPRTLLGKMKYYSC